MKQQKRQEEKVLWWDVFVCIFWLLNPTASTLVHGPLLTDNKDVQCPLLDHSTSTVLPNTPTVFHYYAIMLVCHYYGSTKGQWGVLLLNAVQSTPVHPRTL